MAIATEADTTEFLGGAPTHRTSLSGLLTVIYGTVLWGHLELPIREHLGVSDIEHRVERR